MGALYNPELDGSMDGKSLTKTVTTSSGLLLAAASCTNRRSVTIINRDSTNPIFINYSRGASAATTSNGTIKAGEAISLHVRNNIYAISTGGDVSVTVFTEEDT